MRKILAWPLAFVLVVAASNANAFFFFFIPGGVIGKIGDAITGAEGDICVKDSTKVGEVMTSASGNKATVKSLAGTSSRCQNPALPIRALLVFEYLGSSKACIDIPDGYDPKPLSDLQRFNGNLLKEENLKTQSDFFVSTAVRAANSDMSVLVRNVAGRMVTTLDNAVNSNDEKLQVNGLNALRFEVRGKPKSIFARSHLYGVTILESDNELVVINAWSPDDADKPGLQQLAFRVTGLAPVVADAPLIALPASAPTSTTPAVAAVQPDIVATPDDSTSAIASVGAPLRPAAVPTPVAVTPPPAQVPAASPAPTQATVSTSLAVPAPTGGGSAPNKLRELDKLRKEGVITQGEFEQKKKSLLKEM